MYRAKILRILFLLLFLSLCFTAFSIAGTVPQLINYQGTLTDTSGNPVPDGQYGVVFKIYDVTTGGTALWTETWNNATTPVVTIKGGFSVLLGSNTPIPASFFSDHSLTYLGIKVGNDSEMLPRQRIASVAYALTAGSGGVPVGGIIMWSGAVNQIPEGWALCDGNSGTPDLRDRFVVGAGSGYAVGAKGGEAAHTLTLTEIPAHTHAVDPPSAITSTNGSHSHSVSARDAGTNGSYIGEDNGSGSWHDVSTTASGDHSHSVDIPAFNSGSSGGGQAHNNLPPYYALAFIMKL